MIINIVIGIFGSTFVSLIIYIKEYKDIKRNTLISFGHKVMDITNTLNEYKYGDVKFKNVKHNINILNKVFIEQVTELSNIFWDIEFIYDKHNCKKYIASIYKIFTDTSLLITDSMQLISMGVHDQDTLFGMDCILKSLNLNMRYILPYSHILYDIINGGNIHGKFECEFVDIMKLVFIEQNRDTEEAITNIIDWYKSNPDYILDLMEGFILSDDEKKDIEEKAYEWYKNIQVVVLILAM